MSRCTKKCQNGTRCQRQCDGKKKSCWQHIKSKTTNRLIGGATQSDNFVMPKKGQWEIYGRDTCPYTRRAIDYAKNIPWDVVFHDMLKMNISAQQLIQKLKGKIGNHSTVPMIFDHQNNFIGGFSELNQIAFEEE